MVVADGERREPGLERTLSIALAVGAALSATLLLGVLHPRADIGPALHSPHFLIKLIIALSVVLTAVRLLPQAARPVPRFRQLWLLATPLVLLTVSIAVELWTQPPENWSARLIGHNATHCLSLIPLLSLAPATCLLVALRRGAPFRPVVAGATVGLVAGGVGASLYALTCPDDSPLFVATWYTIAVAVVVLVCAIAGQKTLRW
jgi:hypothetical protein